MVDGEAFEAVNRFWLDEVGTGGWYACDERVDAAVRERFHPLWQAARRGDLRPWLGRARGALAYVILTDQLPRNMFRDDPRAFATDALARAAATRAAGQGMDLAVAEPERQFFYLPFMHSESLSDQERCVRLMATRLRATGADNLLHARTHRAVIRRFGRFPHRNAALGRESRRAERAYEEAGGYGATFREIRQASAVD